MPPILVIKESTTDSRLLDQETENLHSDHDILSSQLSLLKTPENHKLITTSSTTPSITTSTSTSPSTTTTKSITTSTKTTPVTPAKSISISVDMDKSQEVTAVDSTDKKTMSLGTNHN